MTVSAAYKAAIYAQETGEAFLILLKIDHDDFSTPLYFTSDSVNTISNSITHIPFPFRFIAPAMDGERAPQAKLEIDNVDRSIIEAIRGLSSAPTISVSHVLASTPNVIEATWPDFLLMDVEYDRVAISGTLAVESLSREPFPAHSFTPSFFPGLWGGVA